MITFRKRSFWEQIKCKLSPAYKAAADARAKEAIRFLVSHPEAPCAVDFLIIQDGYGAERSISQELFGFKL